MAGKKMLDMSELMHKRPANTTLPGVHGLRTSASAPEAPAKTNAEAPTAVAEKPAEPEAPPTPASPASPPQDETPAAPAAAPKAKKAPARKPRATKADDLVSLDGRPARLWDISDGKELPKGWAAIAVDRVHKQSRKFRADRRNATLPENIYAACNDYIYEAAKNGGPALTLSNLAEAAFEQIPQDDRAGIERLLDSLPDVYFDKSHATRPRTFQLLEPTLEHMQNLARMLRAFGFTSKTGLVQTAALRQLLLDLGVKVE